MNPMFHYRSALLAKIVASALLLLACIAGAGCAQQQESASESGSVAASILGQDISEQSITDYIENFRDVLGYSDDSSWASYLESNSLTPAKMREATIFEFASDIVIAQEAEKQGITVSESEVDDEIAEFRETMLATDDETWESTLEQYKTTEEELRERYKNGLLQDKVYEAVVPETEPTETDMSSYIQENLVGTTSKKFVAVYSPDYTTLQALLEEMNKEKTVAAGMELAKSKADGSTIIYEEYGWDIDSETTSAMKTELESLKVGQRSENLVSDGDVGAYEILYVTDSYTFSEDTKVSELDSSMQDVLKQLTKKRVWNLSCSSWLNEQVNNNIQMNDMPSGLPYDVEVTESSQESSSENQNKTDN